MKIKLLRQSVVITEADAIVNAANVTLLGGGGVDGAIHEAAGPELLEECKSLNGCSTGDAKITGAYNIKNAKYIIHTAGPIYGPHDYDEILLEGCYYHSLERAKGKTLKSIAFPCISTGVYGYPLKDACKAAIKALKIWENENPDYDITVFLCCFTDKEFEAYSSLRCPVCESYFFEEDSFEICPVCGWEDDPVQRKDPDFSGGANKLSLNDAKRKYKGTKHD